MRGKEGKEKMEQDGGVGPKGTRDVKGCRSIKCDLYWQSGRRLCRRGGGRGR